MVHITVKGWQIFPKYSHYVRTLLMHWPVCVIMMVSSVLAPNRCRDISNSPADSIMASYELPYAIRIMLQQLTLNVRGRPSYLGLTRSISWLLMPWLLTSPGHQQPWYWLCRICKPWSYLRKDFKYPCHINVESWHKMQIYVYVPSEKFSTWRVNQAMYHGGQGGHQTC